MEITDQSLSPEEEKSELKPRMAPLKQLALFSEHLVKKLHTLTGVLCNGVLIFIINNEVR